jgi:hypothetical protein
MGSDASRRRGEPRPGIGGYPPARSALGLRLALAIFGLVFCVGAAVVFGVVGPWGLTLVLTIIALTALADIAVISRRMRRRDD